MKPQHLALILLFSTTLVYGWHSHEGESKVDIHNEKLNINQVIDLNTQLSEYLLSPDQKKQNRVLIKGVTVVDGKGGEPIPNANVMIKGNRIQKISTKNINAPSGTEVIDAHGKYIIPGFIDMHTHYWETGAPDTSPTLADFRHVLPWEQHIEWINSRAFYTFSRFLSGGVTTMVEMASPFIAFDLREQAKQISYTPRIRLCGRFMGNTDFNFHYWTEDDPAVIATYDPILMRQWVIEAAEMGANHIKLGYVSIPGFTIEDWIPVFDAAIEESHSRGLKVAIHCTELEPVKEFMRRGVDILAHALWEDAPDEEFFQIALENDVTITTTLYLFRASENVWTRDPKLTDIEAEWGDQQVIDSWDWLNQIPDSLLPPPTPWAAADSFTEHSLETIQRAHEYGIRVVAGSDAGNVGLLAGPSMHREFAMMAEAGMSPGAILKAATWDAAQSLDLDKLGAVEKGYTADLLIIDGDPLDDWQNLANIEYVVTDGILFSHEELVSIEDDTEPIGPILD